MNIPLILVILAVLVVAYFVFSSRKTQARLEAKLPKGVQGAAESLANSTSGVRDAARSAVNANNSPARSTSQATGNE